MSRTIGVSGTPSNKTYPMAGDRVLGDGGNVTVYGRPDGSRYALDKKGRGEELGEDSLILGRARFDPRSQASGRWEGSRSTPQRPEALSSPRRARRHRRS